MLKNETLYGTSIFLSISNGVYMYDLLKIITFEIINVLQNIDNGKI